MIIKFYFYINADRSMPEVVSLRARENKFLVIGQSPQKLLKIGYDLNGECHLLVVEPGTAL